jgi:anti-sigma factor RsiW
MRCDDVRDRILAYQRGQLPPAEHAGVLAHLEQCSACAGEDAAERALTEVLERRLPQHTASFDFKRRLAAQWPVAAGGPSWWRRWARPLAPALAAAVLVLAVVPLYYRHSTVGPSPMVSEAVTDHLRVLSSQNPLEIRSGGIHQVKPWFEGRLDFAPIVRFAGDEEFPLQGGAVGYFLDRKAAVFVFKRRLHLVTLFVFPAEGLPWPARSPLQIGGDRASAASARGFNTLLWREGELGYALVSDVDPAELTRLAAKLVGPS